jgi:hypothetical protein
MDSTWPYNFDCTGLPQNLPSYYDMLIVPTIFYNAVKAKNKYLTYEIIKRHPKLLINVVMFYDNILRGAFYFKKDAKYSMPYKIRWNTTFKDQNIVINPNEQSELYNYITVQPWNNTYMGFLINTINEYLIELRYVMSLINQHMPVEKYYPLGVNVHNSIEMKYFIAKFIPGYKY